MNAITEHDNLAADLDRSNTAVASEHDQHANDVLVARDKHLLEALNHSKVYQDFERSFTESTGLPLALRPVECWQLPLHGKRNEGPFCELMAHKSRTCAACLQTQQALIDSVTDEGATVDCPYGLCDTVVPVGLGDRTIGYLQTGQVFRQKPTKAQFRRMIELLEAWNVEADTEQLEETYFKSRVVPAKQYHFMVQLLNLFAQHLTMVSNQIATQEATAEPGFIARAKVYIRENLSEELSLGRVAKAVHTSSFYFCKMFKKVTGLNFTEYVSRLRIERAKNLLLNRNHRVSEIAYEVGFQSLTHFNRVFRGIVGQSPTEYRKKLRCN